MIKNIVFDMDGVLIDTEAIYMKCWKGLAQKLNLPNVEEVARQCIGITVNETEALFQKAYGKTHPCPSYVQAANDIFYEKEAKEGIPPKPGVYPLFEFLKKNGYRIALASSTKEEAVRRQMKAMGLLDYFEVLVCGDMVKRSKPNPDIYLKACELLQVLPEDSYAVEDSFHGIRAAHDAGMKAIMIPDLLPPTDEILKLTYRKFDSLMEFQSYLEQLHAQEEK